MTIPWDEVPSNLDLKVTSISLVESKQTGFLGFDLEIQEVPTIIPRARMLPSGSIEYFTKSGRRDVVSAASVNRVVEFLKEKQRATTREMSEAFKIGESHISRTLLALRSVNRIRRVRVGKTFYYELTKYSDVLPKGKSVVLPKERPQIDVEAKSVEFKHLKEEQKAKLQAAREA